MAVTHYIWDEGNDTLLMEKDEAGTTIAEYTHEPGRYGPLISQRRGAQTRYHHFDGQGSTRALTDESGTVTDTYTYTAFGETVASTGTTANPFGYKGALGYYANPESNDVHVRRRSYVPAASRWLSTDAFRMDQRYVYARNNPLLFRDPSGLGEIRDVPYPCDAQICRHCLTTYPNDAVLREIMNAIHKLPKKCDFEVKCCEKDRDYGKKDPCDACREYPGMVGACWSVTWPDWMGGGPVPPWLVSLLKKPTVVLCSWRFTDYSKMKDSPWNQCTSIWETLPHELLHVLSVCALQQKQRKDDPVATKCQHCLCEELRAGTYSKQYVPGAVWYETGGGPFGKGVPYASTAECLIDIAKKSCSFKCDGKTEEEIKSEASKLLSDETCSELPFPSPYGERP